MAKKTLTTFALAAALLGTGSAASAYTSQEQPSNTPSSPTQLAKTGGMFDAQLLTAAGLVAAGALVVGAAAKRRRGEETH